MGVEKSRPSDSIQGLFGIVLAVAALGVTPLPLTADIASVSGFSFYGESDSGLIAYDLNPDGSVDVTLNQPFSGTWILPEGPQCGGRICVAGVDFPALPQGSTINSATFSFDAMPVYPVFNVGNFGSVTISGSAAALTNFTLYDSSGCSFGGTGLIGAENTFSFVPCTTSGVNYYPAFSGADTFTLTPDTQYEEPGSYYAGYNAIASVNYTVTVDYSVLPEPSTYGFMVGLIMVGLVAIKFRKPLTNRSHPR